MLILRTSIRILFLLIIAICYQITTKNNISLYLQPLYAKPDDQVSTGNSSSNDNRDALLKAIREGVPLKPVEERKIKERPVSSPNDAASIFSRRIAMEPSDTESDSSSISSNSDWEDDSDGGYKQNNTEEKKHPLQNGNDKDTHPKPSNPPPPPPPPPYNSVKNTKNKESLVGEILDKLKKMFKGNRNKESTSNATNIDHVSSTKSPPPPPAYSNAGATPEPTSNSQLSATEEDQQGEVPPPPPPPLQQDPATQIEDDENCDDTLPPPPTEEELADVCAKPTSNPQPSDTEEDQQGEVPPPPPPPLKKDQATQTEDVDTTPQPESAHKEPIEEDENDSLIELNSFSELQKSSAIDHTNAAQYHNTSRAVIHYTSIPMKVVNNFISRKIVNNSSGSHTGYIGASESNSILHQKKYELECKYVYNATMIPQKNALGKARIIGAIMNLKYQLSNRLTAGMFYAPTITTYTIRNKRNNNTIAATNKNNIINHCIGMYTSYAITPATYLSNQVSVGFSTMNDKNRDKNSSKKSNYPHCFTLDSFINHKIKMDATKTMSPLLGLSYYSTNPHLYHNIGDINNLSLVMGIKFQYEYKYKDLAFAPSVKFTHTRSLYSNISAKMQNKNIIAQGEHLIDLLRDFHIAFNPNSSVNLALSIRRRDLRFAAGYEYSIHHECDNSYSHTFFARINITF